MFDLSSTIHMLRHDLNLMRTIKVVNFLNNPKIQHKINELELKNLTCLNKS
jgi:hypothetical protein